MEVVAPYTQLRREGLAAVGLALEPRYQSYADSFRDAARCGLPFWGGAWRARVATPAYFLQLLYGPNVSKGLNWACYESSTFDRLFERARATPPGPARDALFARMLDQVARDGVWQIGTERAAMTLAQARITETGRHPLYASP